MENKKQMTLAQLASDMRANPEKYVGKQITTRDNRVGTIIGVDERGPVVKWKEN